MLAPMLKTTALNTQQNTDGAGAKSPASKSPSDEFSRVFKQQDQQRLREKSTAEMRNKGIERPPEHNHVGSKGPDQTKVDSRHQQPKAKTETKLDNHSAKGLSVDDKFLSAAQNAQPGATLEDMDGLQGWMHYVQAAAELELGENRVKNSSLNDELAVGGEALGLNRSIAVLLTGEGIDQELNSASVAGNSLGNNSELSTITLNLPGLGAETITGAIAGPSLAGVSVTAGEVAAATAGNTNVLSLTNNQPLALALSESGGQNLTLIQQDLAAKVATSVSMDASGDFADQLATANSLLLTATEGSSVKMALTENSLGNGFGSNFDNGLLKGELPNFNGLTKDMLASEAAQQATTQAKGLGQADSTAASSSLANAEHKTFFQLRFNQQTLAADLAEKTGWIVEHKLDTAQIQLDPAELGPIAVKIHTHQDQVSVSFVVTNPQVRDAMDQTLQRLKELLNEQGVTLAHADVNDQRQRRDDNEPEAGGRAGRGDVDDEEVLAVALPLNTLGVDQFV